MKKDSNNKVLAGEWFERAEDDLRFAKAGFKETGIARDACFLSHQAVEKYLKGYLVSQGTEPDRIHILPKLLRECIKINKDFTELKEGCEFLNKFYRPARYPGGAVFEFTKEEGKKSLKITEEIIDFIKKKIQY